MRFNIHDLPKTSSGCGFSGRGLMNLEQPSVPRDVIVLSSDDDERPPSPKRVRQEHQVNSFTISETSGNNCMMTFGQNTAAMPSALGAHSHDLNDSLEECEMQHHLECPLVEGQSAMDVGEELLLDQQPLARSPFTLNLQPTHYQSCDIYGSLNISHEGSGPSDGGEHRQQEYHSNMHSVFDPVTVDSSSTSSSSSAALNLVKSTSWEGKTPTQKQIRETVMNSISRIEATPGTYDPFPLPNNHVTNTARMAREYFSGDPPPGFVAGAIVRSTPPDCDNDRTMLSAGVEHTPLRSLTLGNEDDGRRIWLQSNDRSLASSSGSQGYSCASNQRICFSKTPQADNVGLQVQQGTGGNGRGYSSRLPASANYNLIEGTTPSTRRSFGRVEREQTSTISRFSDLKTFHQLQHPPPVATTAGGRACEPAGPGREEYRGSGQTELCIDDDPWMGCGVIGPSIKAKVLLTILCRDTCCM